LSKVQQVSTSGAEQLKLEQQHGQADWGQQRVLMPGSPEDNHPLPPWVEWIESFKFLFGPIMVQTHQHSREDGTTIPLPHHKAKKCWLGPSDTQNSCTIESILTGCITTWYGNYSASSHKAEDSAYGPVHHWGRTTSPFRISIPGSTGALNLGTHTLTHTTLTLQHTHYICSHTQNTHMHIHTTHTHSHRHTFTLHISCCYSVNYIS
jgi:hypothetical protein